MTDTVIDVGTGELVPYEPQATALITGNTPDEIIGHATVIANSLRDVIERQGFAVSMGRNRKPHVEVGGWQAAGAMLGAFGGQALHAETVFSRREDRADEIAYTAKVEIKTLAGDVVGSAEGFCSSAEDGWKGRDEYAIKSMAETRAEGRAYRRPLSWLVSMAGYSPTAAEEMPPAEPQPAPALPAWAQGVDDDTLVTFAHNLVYLLEQAGVPSPAEKVNGAGKLGRLTLEECDRTIPACVAALAARLAGIVAMKTATQENPA